MPTRPFFLPWIGAEYSPGVGGCRLLVLGESHYSEDPRNAYPALTRDIVGRVLDGEHFPFFSKVGAVMQGALDGGTYTWNRVAFYNFVQELVGAHARDRPTDAMWASGMEPFQQILSDLQPHAVLVCGVGTWNGLSQHFPETAMSDATASGELVRRWQLPGIPPLAATWIDHPASFGFRSVDWTERASTLLAEARLMSPERGA
jgi:hypothetical protein